MPTAEELVRQLNDRPFLSAREFSEAVQTIAESNPPRTRRELMFAAHRRKWVRVRGKGKSALLAIRASSS